MFRTDVWALPPGITGAVETYENAFRWGPTGLGLITGGIIAATTVDSGNTPTYELRPGLVLGQIAASGLWTNYSNTATDGSEVATGVLITSVRMTDILTGAGVQRFYGILVGGPVQAAKLFGLDLMARATMADHFQFDDAVGYPGNHWFPYRRFQTKTANYTIVAGDNFTLFDNTGAGGEVDLTLPAIANGYMFAARAQAAQVIKFISAEGGNIVGTAATNSSASVTAIGGVIVIYSNPAGTKWIVEQHGTQTITFA